MSNPYDIEFFWDPVCPVAWITSRWVAKVSAQTGYRIDWRFISLRLLNKDKDYRIAIPPEYERGHTAGLRMLRVAAKVRAELGREPMGPLYEGYGRAYWDQEKGAGMRQRPCTSGDAWRVPPGLASLAPAPQKCAIPSRNSPDTAPRCADQTSRQRRMRTMQTIFA